MFLGISEGLSDFGKAMQQSDIENKRLGAESAREAANQAFHMNLARFTAGEEGKRQEATLGAQERWHTQETTERAQEHAEQIKERAQEHSEQIKERQAETAERGRETDARLAETKQRDAEREQNRAELDNQRKEHAELFKQQVEASKAAMQRGDSAEAERIAKEMVDTPRALYSGAVKEVDAMRKAPGFDPDSNEYKNAVSDMQTAKKSLTDAETASAALRAKALQGINYGDKPAADDPIAKANLNPDQQAYAKKARDAGASAEDAIRAAKNAPPDVLQKYISTPAPPAGAATAPATTPAAKAGAFLQQDGTAAPPSPDGSAAPRQLVAANAAPDDSAAPPADASTPDQSQAPPPGANAVVQAGAPDQGQDQTQDPSQRYEEMSDQMSQDPQGQGILATLGRLSTAQSGPVADKMRRTAEIQIEQQYPDDDANGFIDHFLDQNQQETV
jgi:hypothetical protein